MFTMLVALTGCDPAPIAPVPLPTACLEGASHGVAFHGEPEVGVACEDGALCDPGMACDIGNGVSCSATRGNVWCDDALDCGPDTVCCATRDPELFYGTTACVAAEACAGAVVCTGDDECGEGACVRTFTQGGVTRLGVCQAEPATPCTPGPGANCDCADLTGVDLFGEDLTGASFVGANLTDAQLQYAQLDHATLDRAVMRHANLFDVWMDGVSAVEIDLAETYVTALSAEGIVLAGANLRDGALHGGSFAGADLSGADLTSASLGGRNAAEWIDLGGADLSAADLSSATLMYVNLTAADLSDAILDGTTWLGVTCPDLTTVSIDGSGSCVDHTR